MVYVLQKGKNANEGLCKLRQHTAAKALATAVEVAAVSWLMAAEFELAVDVTAPARDSAQVSQAQSGMCSQMCAVYSLWWQVVHQLCAWHRTYCWRHLQVLLPLHLCCLNWHHPEPASAS